MICWIIFCSKNVCFMHVYVDWDLRGSVKKIWDYFLVQKCVFYACFMLIGTWEGAKKPIRVGIFFE